jgi:hypothetical protein
VTEADETGSSASSLTVIITELLTQPPLVVMNISSLLGGGGLDAVTESEALLFASETSATMSP